MPSVIADTGLSVPADPWALPNLGGVSTLKSLASLAGSFLTPKPSAAPGMYGYNPYANPAPGTKFPVNPYYQGQPTPGAGSTIPPWALIAAAGVALYAIN